MYSMYIVHSIIWFNQTNVVNMCIDLVIRPKMYRRQKKNILNQAYLINFGLKII